MGLAFFELDIWKEGFDLSEKIYKLTRNFPKEEVYSLIDQILRSSNSIIANIAEAHGRFHFADKVRVLYQSRGELSETRSHLRVALSRGYINQKDFNILDEKYKILEIKLNNLISSNKKSKMKN